MSVDEKIWELHDRRLNEHENRFNKGAENHQELTSALKQLTERINEGLSKSVGRVLEEQSKIHLGMKDLTHKIDIDLLKMKEQYEAAQERVIARVTNVETQQDKMSNIFLWSIVAGVVAGLTYFGITKVTDKLGSKAHADDIERIESLKAEPIRKGRG